MRERLRTCRPKKGCLTPGCRSCSPQLMLRLLCRGWPSSSPLAALGLFVQKAFGFFRQSGRTHAGCRKRRVTAARCSQLQLIPFAGPSEGATRDSISELLGPVPYTSLRSRVVTGEPLKLEVFYTKLGWTVYCQERLSSWLCIPAWPGRKSNFDPPELLMPLVVRLRSDLPRVSRLS